MQHDSNSNSAVTFDVEAFAGWLDGPSSPGTAAQPNRDAYPLLATAYQRNDGTSGWLVEQVLDALRTAPQADGSPVWAYGLGVTDVRVWATAGVEDGADGGLVGEVAVDGVILSLGRLADADLVPDAEVIPGYEAAAHALSALADQVNAAAAALRTGRPAPAGDWMFGELSTADVEAALITLAEYVENCETPDVLSIRQMEVALQVRQIAGGLGVGTDDEDEVVDAEIVD